MLVTPRGAVAAHSMKPANTAGACSASNAMLPA